MGKSIKVRSILVGVRKGPVCNTSSQFRERPVIHKDQAYSLRLIREVYECLACNRVFDFLPVQEVPEKASEPTVVRLTQPLDTTGWPRVSTAPPREPTMPPDFWNRRMRSGPNQTRRRD